MEQDRGEQRWEQNKEEQLVNQIHKLNEKRWITGLYFVMVLFSCGTFALNMNYSQVLSGQLFMTVWVSFMAGAFSFAYGVWFVFLYIWIEGKDGKMAQDFIESIYWMPCSVERLFDAIFARLWKKMRLLGILIILILTAGIFIGPYTDERAGTGIGFQQPEHIVLSVLVCAVGTAWVLIWMFLGSFIAKQSRLSVYYRKRNGQKTKGKIK